jgi:hypothetical protein
LFLVFLLILRIVFKPPNGWRFRRLAKLIPIIILPGNTNIYFYFFSPRLAKSPETGWAQVIL